MTVDKTKVSKHLFFELIWDIGCAVSLIGIWPRFIEPYLLDTTTLPLKIRQCPISLKGLKIVQLSDLHFHPAVPDFFLRKLSDKVKVLNPDLIVFTGDFICQSDLLKKSRLKDFLCSFSAPFGCYAVLGNHDYQQPVSINSKGEYDLIQSESSTISKGFFRLFSNIELAKRTTDRAKRVGKHQELVDLIRETPFILLDNESKRIAIKDTYLNICGLGEYTLAQCLPLKAFKEYDVNFPGLILTHNPDSIPLLKDFPGDIIVCGHTHGGQINLPWIWKKLTLLENKRYKKGLFFDGKKLIYVSRGLGSVLPFRWFARPEIVLITLE